MNTGKVKEYICSTRTSFKTKVDITNNYSSILDIYRCGLWWSCRSYIGVYLLYRYDAAPAGQEKTKTGTCVCFFLINVFEDKLNLLCFEKVILYKVNIFVATIAFRNVKFCRNKYVELWCADVNVIIIMFHIRKKFSRKTYKL